MFRAECACSLSTWNKRSTDERSRDSIAAYDSAAQETVQHQQRYCTDCKRSNGFLFYERRHAVQCVAVTLGELTSNLPTRTFSFQPRITEQFPNGALGFAGKFFCNTFDLFTLHNSPHLSA